MLIGLGTGCHRVVSMPLTLATEDDQAALTKIEIQTQDQKQQVLMSIDGVRPGSTELPISGVPSGDYYAYFSSAGYASQWQILKVNPGKTEPAKVKMFRKRYVVLRYAFNTTGGRQLTGEGVEEGEAAVAHWGSLPYFQQDWQIWQKGSRDEMFGDTPFLEFHRFSAGFGFVKPPESVTFDDMKEAPASAEYKCESMKAVKGLTLYCRVEGNQPNGLGYGKITVEDVTETPPPAIKRVEDPRRR